MLRLQITLPHDIHPLPDDISAYVGRRQLRTQMKPADSLDQFVYPYSLENHVLAPQPPHISHAERIRTLQEQHATRTKYLKDREDDKARKKREQLRKVAPGWEPDETDEGISGKRHSAILEPTRKVAQQAAVPPPPQSVQGKAAAVSEPEKPRDVMDDLVEGLARMDELETSRSAKEQ